MLSFENSQPTLGGKILAPIEVLRDETTLLIALLSSTQQSVGKFKTITKQNYQKLKLAKKLDEKKNEN